MKRIKIPDINKWFWNLSVVKNVLEWSQTYSFPGFSKVPIYDVVVIFLREIKRFDLFTRANATAYSFFLSLFPALIALFTLIPLFKSYFIIYLPGGENFDEYLRLSILDIMPGIAGEQLFSFIDGYINSKRFGLLSFGFILAIYFGSNGMIALMTGFEKDDLEHFKNRNFLKKRGIAIFLTVLLGILLVASVILVILGQTIIEFADFYLELDFIVKFTINMTRWIAIIMLFYFGITTIYRYGAPTKQKFKFFSPGATIATIGCILASVGFSYYVDTIKTENQLYGTLWTIVVIMLWIQINSLVLLIGFEVNAGITLNKPMKNGNPTN